MKRLALFAVLVLWAAPSAAQLVEPNQIGVRMGHIHLAVRDVDAQKQFWTSVMGGTLVKNGPLELIQFPGVYIMLRKAEPPAPPAGSIVNHFGFIVKDMPAALAQMEGRQPQDRAHRESQRGVRRGARRHPRGGVRRTGPAHPGEHEPHSLLSPSTSPPSKPGT